ncbi:unnamed protein product [Colias eurytheme]|nr:unnamed protein product [Colias eurytheme]
MDSSSNNSELGWPKMEYDSDGEREPTKTKVDRPHWNSENTMKLIETMERECKELWDTSHPLNKVRTARQTKYEYLATMFGTTAEEISRKVHNLRTQFNNELRKIKRKQGGVPEVSGWEYFDALLFLQRAPLVDPLDTIEAVNLELAEFQADEEIEFGAARARSTATFSPKHRKPAIRVPANIPSSHCEVRVAPLPPAAHPMMWPEEPKPRIRPGITPDECQIFGDFVASELRTLRSAENRKRLKRIIQKAILQIGEEEDVNIIRS